MLLRAYRVTDKLGIVLLKTSLVAGGIALEGAHTLVAGIGGILGGLLGILVLLFGGLVWLRRRS